MTGAWRQADENDRAGRTLEAAWRRVDELAAELAQAHAGAAHLRQELARRDESLKRRGEAIARSTHELKNALTSLLVLAEVLAANKRGNLAPDQVDAARAIHAAGRIVLELVAEMADLGKGRDAREARPARAPVPLAELVARLQTTFGVEAERRGLGFTVALDPALPASLETNGRRLEQILRNLIGNALKFTRSGAVRLDVRMGRVPAPRLNAPTDLGTLAAVSFAVTDTGPGIPPESLDVLFEPYRRGANAERDAVEGSGLGLAISRELAHALGGTLGAQSELGTGSTFTLYLPLEEGR